jgi:hypothetical protein
LFFHDRTGSGKSTFYFDMATVSTADAMSFSRYPDRYRGHGFPEKYEGRNFQEGVYHVQKTPNFATENAM